MTEQEQQEYEQQQGPEGYNHGRGYGEGNYIDRASNPSQTETSPENLEYQRQQRLQEDRENQQEQRPE